MKNYVFKKQGIVVKAKSERQAREIYNQYLHDSSDLGVAEFLKSKGIKFSKIDGTKGNIIIKFDNEKDWTLGSKHLRTKYGKKGYESIKEGDKYQVILGDSFNDDSTVTISVKPKGYLTSKNTQNTAEEIYNVTIKRRSNGDITVSGKIQNIEKFLKQSLFDGGLVPGSIKIVKDSLTEDADFYGANQGSEKADDILFALQVMYGEPKYSYNDFRKMNLSQTEINKALAYVKKKGYNKHTYFDSTEDANYTVRSFVDKPLEDFCKKHNVSIKVNGPYITFTGNKSDLAKIHDRFFSEYTFNLDSITINYNVK